MERPLKIALLGDFNYTYNAHHATNFSIDHAAAFLEVDCNYYWMSFDDYIQNKTDKSNYFDAYWITPGPYRNEENLNKSIELLLTSKKPILITGIAFSNLIRVLAMQYNVGDGKIVSENLISKAVFEKVNLTLKTPQLRKLYEHRSKDELTDIRFSLYPSVMEKLSSSIVDLEASNQYDAPEIISLKERKFFVATQCYPQISSTKDIPHPIVYTFLKAILI